MAQQTTINENNNNHNGHVHDQSTSPHLTKLIIPVNGDKSTFDKSYNTPIVDANATKQQKPKQKRRDKSDLGDDFVAPDGGWGWLVTVASGIAVVSIWSNWNILPWTFTWLEGVHCSWLHLVWPNSSALFSEIICTVLASPVRSWRRLSTHRLPFPP